MTWDTLDSQSLRISVGKERERERMGGWRDQSGEEREEEAPNANNLDFLLLFFL